MKKWRDLFDIEFRGVMWGDEGPCFVPENLHREVILFNYRSWSGLGLGLGLGVNHIRICIRGSVYGWSGEGWSLDISM